MNKYRIPKVEYKITYTVKGTCPHCKKEINEEKLEEFYDEYPKPSYFSESSALFRYNVDTYLGYIREHPILENLMKVRNGWHEKLNKELPIISKVKSETIYVIEGECPYCSATTTLREPFRIGVYVPPCVEPGELQETHTLGRCSVCGEIIHVFQGFFKTSQECHPEHLEHKKTSTTTRRVEIIRSNDDSNPLLWLNCRKCGVDLKKHPFRMGKKYECVCQGCNERFKIPLIFIKKHPLKPWKDGESLFCDGAFLEKLIGKKPRGSEQCEPSGAGESREEKHED